MNQIDQLDREIVQYLYQDGRAAIIDIANALDEPPSTIRARLRRLESSGIITGYRPIIDPKKLGFGVQAIVQVQRDTKGQPESIITPLKRISQVTNVIVPLGQVDGFVTVWAKSIDALGQIIRDINNIPNVVRTETLVILHEEAMRPPL